MAAKRNKIPTIPLILGMAGLLPFLASSLSIIFLQDLLREQATLSLMAYAAVILSFLGGVHWGARIGTKAKVSNWSGMIWGVVPSLIAWPSLLLPPIICLCVLTAGFALQYFLDTDSVSTKLFPVWYGRLRAILTAGAIVSLLVGLVAVVVM